jgi:hypothetical protein
MNPDELPQDLALARADASDLLYSAAEEQRISHEVLELRLALIGEAPSPAAVAAIVADLAPTGGYDAVPIETQTAWANAPEYLRLSAVFGSTKREGRWTAPLSLDIESICGEVHVDLRDASFGADVLEIHADVWFGEVVITVPSGTEVRNECSTILGGSKHVRPKRGPAPPNGLLVIVTGKVVCGDLKTREKLPSELAPAPPPGIRGWLARVTGQLD